jgi:hypothetical protein
MFDKTKAKFKSYTLLQPFFFIFDDFIHQKTSIASIG